MLDTAQSRGIVSKVTNIVDEYLENQEALATSLPYFEGDYWVGEIETLIEEVAKEEKGNWDELVASAGAPRRTITNKFRVFICVS